jgi:hypothetical protein
MTTPNTPIASIARLARRARAVSLPLLAAGALAAGCGTVAANPGGPDQPAAAGGTTSASSSASGSAPSSAPGSAPGSAPSAGAKPVPTVSGGTNILMGGSACDGWPANAAHGKLSPVFTPVAVERCVSGYQQIPGKGEWLTATLEKSTDKLATLSAVLMRPSGRQPAVFCPALAVIPPQIVLISSTGQDLIPRLPIGDCGSVDSEVLGTLAAMAWQPLSVRLVSKVSPAAPKTFPGASIGPGSIKVSPAADSPKVVRTGAATGVENGAPVH